MKLLKKSLAVILALMMLAGTFTCFAAELNGDAVNEHYGQYKNYLLLGDSAASGYRDVMSDKDDAFNKQYNETVYYRVPGSYADVLANAIIQDKSMTAFAGCGFRTIEIRYMLEDDFAATCDDPYLFHPAQLYVYEDKGYLPGDERIRQAYKDAVKNADLITLGVGGNDWGAYLGWVIADLMEKENVADKYIAMIEDVLAESMDIGTVEKLVEIAHLAGVLPELLPGVLEALNYGLGNFYKNWDIMIDGASKFGYTYVDTAGTTYVDSHPDADGHVFIANKIIEALPDADIFNKFTDTTPAHKYYKEMEYVVKNGYMSGTSETTFSPDEALTKAQLSKALNVITGDYEISDSTDAVSKFNFALEMNSNVPKNGFIGWIKALFLTVKIAFSGVGEITRGEAAKYIMQYTSL